MPTLVEGVTALVLLSCLKVFAPKYPVRVKPQVLEVLKKGGVYDMVGPDDIHHNTDEAVEAYLRDRQIES